MPSIDNVSAALAQQIAGLIRTQVGTLQKKPTAARKAADARSHQAAQGDSDLASVVARRIQEIDRNTPDPQRRAFHIFLESVVLAELGDDLANDPGFFQLIEDVHRQMEDDPKLGPMVQQAGALLLGRRGPLD